MKTNNGEDFDPVAIGDSVKVITEDYNHVTALVTTVHGEFNEGSFIPCINVAYVSPDDTKRDPYGRQIDRLSSLQHISQARGMPHIGRCWENV